MDIRKREFQIMRNGRAIKVFWPCQYCYECDTCRKATGCYRWKTWFRAVWSELRGQYA